MKNLKNCLKTSCKQHIGDRIRSTLKVARISPRNLGGATQVHFVTIYRVMSSADGSLTQPYEHTLTAALDRIDTLVKEGKLPIQEKLSGVEKTARLAAMLKD